MRLLISVALVMAVVFAACGGDDDDDDGGGGQATPAATASGGGDATSTPATSDDGDDDDGGSGGGTVEMGELPPPGEGWLEVDGKQFVFLESEAASERIFHCELGENAITINFQSDENDMTVQGSNLTGEWFLMVNARPRDAEGGYGSDGNRFATEGQAFVYEGQFSFTPDADRLDFQDVGEGRVAVTCP